MYHLTDQQIEFISNDIRSRGISIESLHQDLLDHICCIIEQNLDANGDFTNFYENTIKTFYKKELFEIEEETISLLTNKNYYTMKKIMIVSGIASAFVLSCGIFFKFMHYPGAGMLMVLGITAFSFLFLPLMFTLKIKEKKQIKDKVLLGLGSLVGILISLGILFKIMHWPYANMIGITAVGILILLYLPINLVSGIRNPDTKVNTIVSSVLLVAGCGLFLSLARSPKGSKESFVRTTEFFVLYDQLLQNEIKYLENLSHGSEYPGLFSQKRKAIIVKAEELKSYILEKETGKKKINPDFESQQAWISDTFSEVYFSPDSEGAHLFKSLKQLIIEYNASGKSIPGFDPVPDAAIITGNGNERVSDVLNKLILLELFALQNEKLSMR
jgi:hypothetical protein